MTEQQKQHAAEVLIGTKALNGGEDGKFLPKLYVVNGKCYMFLNVARRAALGTEYPIEVLSIEEAWQTHLHLPADSLDQKAVDWEFDLHIGRYCHIYRNSDSRSKGDYFLPELRKRKLELVEINPAL